MNIVIPMAGRGSRFAEAGFTTPKPLIPVRGLPMYAWAVEGLPLDRASRLVFVVLREHVEGTDVVDDIKTRYAKLRPIVVQLDAITHGQLCTVLAARDAIDGDEPLLIFNADTYCRTGFAKAVDAFAADVAGALGVFAAPGDHWSFARTDAAGRVVETAEKKRISRHCSTGLYWFKRGCEFVKHADAMIAADERTRGEFYVAPLYNRLIADGRDVRLIEAEEVWAMGTPAELDTFLARCPHAVPTP